jgi:hypothetical protein
LFIAIIYYTTALLREYLREGADFVRLVCEYSSMAARERDDDEMDLINAEFESMVADLNLDQSSPTTYLDDLDAIAAAEKLENSEIYYPQKVRRGLHGTISHLVESIRSWWGRPSNDDTDGAVV